MIKTFIRWLLTRLYRIELQGFENYRMAGQRVLIVANHTSLLDPVLLWAFLPDEITFAISTQIVRQWWVKPGLRFAKVFPMDPTQPLAVKGLTHHLKEDRKAVIFPEGRITVTGSLMKIYDGAGLIAEKARATVLPIRIDGAQYTPFSYMRGIVRQRWFPKISISILPPQNICPPAELSPHERRRWAGTALADVMSEMLFSTAQTGQTVFDALLDARKVHGGRHIVLEDAQRNPAHYNRLITQTLALSRALEPLTETGERVGVLLPNMIGNVATFLGLQVAGRIPAMLNFSSGSKTIAACCTLAGVRTVVTARRFVGMAKLEPTVELLTQQARVVYLEDLAAGLGRRDKLRALAAAWFAEPRRYPGNPDDPAVILFTSGSEGVPKGVALSHRNLLANREQLVTRLDFNARDTILNALPMFHAFGLTAGTLLPLLSGMRTFLYPSPLHYRIIPEICYDIGATILFGTNTFLAGYAKYAHPYDFFSVRYVFAGAEKLQANTRKVWADKFGLRVIEGYGATETSPVLSANTPMFFREGTVGRLMPGIDWKLEPVEGVERGGKLHVAGPNVMLGYLKRDGSGEIETTRSIYGTGWYDTGDVVNVDAEGFVTILGRVKRFAKIGGEMISLGVVEDLATELWPKHRHAAVALADEKKGEKIILVTDTPDPDRTLFGRELQARGLSELNLPREIRYLKDIPVLATGKVDYRGLEEALRSGGAG